MWSQGPRALLSNWVNIQSEIEKCSDCIGKWPGHIKQPLEEGEIPHPPAHVRLLFVGVAPTPIEGMSRGGHFYSSCRDPLRAGLFKVLDGVFNSRLSNLDLSAGNTVFHELGCFFVHCAKVRPIRHPAPPADAIRYCALKHLKEEIQALRPQGICFLGINNAGPAADALFGTELSTNALRVTLGTWLGWAAVAHQPRRGWERYTKAAIEQLLSASSLKESPD